MAQRLEGSQTQPATANHLARIRANQRRSRARRQEYLQDLESRLRQCEILGAQASIEIQHAARRVADENRCLKALLRANGAVEEENDAIDALEALLEVRRDCGGHSGGSDNKSNTTRGVTMLRRLTTVGLQGSVAVEKTACHAVDRKRPQNPLPTPSGGSGFGPSTLSPQSPSSHPSADFRHLKNAEIHDPTKQPAQSQNPNTSFAPPPTSYHDSPLTQNSRSASEPLVSKPPTATEAHLITPTAQANSNSCILATDMIATMAGGDPVSVRTELGCGIEADGECEVENELVFEVLDRWKSASVS